MQQGNRYLLTGYDHDGLRGVLFKVSWQQTEPKRQRKYTSKLFAFKDYSNEDAAFSAAIKYRDEWLTNNPAIKLQKERDDRYFLTPPSNNTSGILGVNRTFDTLKSGQKSYFWQAAWRDQTGKSINKSFSVNRHGEDEALRLAVQARRDALIGMKEGLTEGEQALIDFYDDIIENIGQYTNYLEPSIAEVACTPNIGATEKFESIKIRIGQQRFRREVLDYFDKVCPITKSSALVRASHIKPWSISTNEERLNPSNGLALSPIYDAAFDKGLITFDDDGCIVLSQSNELDLRRLGVNGSERIVNLSGEHKVFLTWHRENIFISNKNA